MNFLQQLLPLLGIGLAFAFVYELILWFYQKRVENKEKEDGKAQHHSEKTHQILKKEKYTA